VLRRADTRRDRRSAGAAARHGQDADPAGAAEAERTAGRGEVMGERDHTAQRDAAGLYALGALAGKERDEFEAHLATCEECSAEVRSLGAVVNALPHARPQADPPPALRARVLAAAGDPKASSRATATVTPMPARSRSWPSSPGWLAGAGLGGLRGGVGALPADRAQ